MLKILLAVSNLSLLMACNAPDKPEVLIGVVDYPREEVIEGRSGSDIDPVRVPLSTYDKATCFKPDQWELVQNYIHEMEAYIRGGCK